MSGRERIDRLRLLDYQADCHSIGGRYTELEAVQTEAESLVESLVADLNAPIRWRPIEEAPKDGTRVLLWNAGVAYLGWWDMRQSHWVADGLLYVRPTHFCPLTPPEPTP